MGSSHPKSRSGGDRMGHDGAGILSTPACNADRRPSRKVVPACLAVAVALTAALAPHASAAVTPPGQPATGPGGSATPWSGVYHDPATGKPPLTSFANG